MANSLRISNYRNVAWWRGMSECPIIKCLGKIVSLDQNSLECKYQFEEKDHVLNVESSFHFVYLCCRRKEEGGKGKESKANMAICWQSLILRGRTIGI